jgi:transposase
VGDKNGNKITIKEKEIVYWSLAHYRREVAQNQKFIEYLESCKDHPDKLKDRQRKTAEFISITQIDPKTGDKVRTKTKIELNEEKIQKYKDTMGYYMIVTSEIDTPDRDIINKYHGLSRIEDSFRIIKSDLEGRPIYVRTNEHIKAHFLICFIALTLIRVLQYKLLNAKGQHKAIDTDGWKQGMTADRIKKALANYKVNTDKNGICLVHGFSEDLQEIYESIGVDSKIAAPTTNELNRIIKNIKTTQII